MIVYYLDASAWVKRYYQEPGTVWLQNLFAQQPIFACATLGFIEVTATLARKGKSGRVDPDLLKQKIQELETDWQNFVQIQLTSEVVARAKDLAEDLTLRGADSIHLASAVVLQSRLAESDQLVMITSDQELKEAGQTSGLLSFDPSEEEAKTSNQP